MAWTSAVSLIILIAIVAMGVFLVVKHDSKLSGLAERRAARKAGRFFFPTATVASFMMMAGEALSSTGNTFVACLAMVLFILGIFSSLVAWFTWSSSEDEPHHDDTLRA